MRNLAFWEQRHSATLQQLSNLERGLRGKVLAAPKRRAPLRDDMTTVLRQTRPGNWRKWNAAYTRWKVLKAKRRRLFKLVETLKRRIVYINKRIVVLKARTVWQMVDRGVL